MSETARERAVNMFQLITVPMTHQAMIDYFASQLDDHAAAKDAEITRLRQRVEELETKIGAIADEIKAECVQSDNDLGGSKTWLTCTVRAHDDLRTWHRRLAALRGEGGK